MIGDEILIGRVTDTNSGMLARMLEPVGWTVAGVETCGDSAASISGAINQAMADADIVLTTGGLGPTRDDITKQVLMDIFGGELRLDPDVAANVERIMSRRGLKVNALTATQAMVPTSCEVLENRAGTAPGMLFSKDGKTLVAMPGVPAETRTMFPDVVLPRLLSLYGEECGSVQHRTLIVEGIPESEIAERLAAWEDALPASMHLAYLPNMSVVRLRIDGTGNDAAALAQKMDRAHAELCELMADHLLCDHDATPEEQLLKMLTDRGLTIATAESCTGGNIAHTLTLVPGSSAAVKGGVVAYSNEVKESLLGVSPLTLQANGAVSEPVVEEMALGALAACEADIAVATSGIAGPSGAVPGKPVGTVCIAVADSNGSDSMRFRFPGNRADVINRATQRALIMAIRRLSM